MKRAKREPGLRAKFRDSRIAKARAAAPGGWLAQHFAPPRHTRRAYEAIARSKNPSVEAIMRVTHCDGPTAIEIVRQLKETPRAVLGGAAADAAAHEKLRAGLCVRYCGGRAQAVAMNEIPKARKRSTKRAPTVCEIPEEA